MNQVLRFKTVAPFPIVTRFRPDIMKIVGICLVFIPVVILHPFEINDLKVTLLIWRHHQIWINHCFRMRIKISWLTQNWKLSKMTSRPPENWLPLMPAFTLVGGGWIHPMKGIYKSSRLVCADGFLHSEARCRGSDISSPDLGSSRQHLTIETSGKNVRLIKEVLLAKAPIADHPHRLDTSFWLALNVIKLNQYTSVRPKKRISRTDTHCGSGQGQPVQLLWPRLHLPTLEQSPEAKPNGSWWLGES